MAKRSTLFLCLCVLVPNVLGAEPIERPKAGATVEEKVTFYVSRLKDATYGQQLKGDDAHAGFWRTAPEELGLIGAPAIEPIIKRIEVSQNETELTWAFYALLLASQAKDIEAKLGRIIPEKCYSHPYNDVANHPLLRKLWLDWWQKYGSSIHDLAAKPHQPSSSSVQGGKTAPGAPN